MKDSEFLKRQIDDSEDGTSEIPDRELVRANPRAYAHRMYLRDQYQRALILEQHGIVDHELGLLRAFADRSLRERLESLLRSLNLAAIEKQLRAAESAIDSVRLWICEQCEEIRDASEHVPGDARCALCFLRWRTARSWPYANGVERALYRARSAGLPATLTEKEWSDAVVHFADRCAYCGGAWRVVEHATSIRDGGGTTAANCLPACNSCNSTKRERTIEQCISDGPHWRNVFDQGRLEHALTWLRSKGRASV